MVVCQKQLDNRLAKDVSNSNTGSNYEVFAVLCRAELLRGLKNFLYMDRPEHHSTDRLKEREMQKGSGRQPTL